MGAAHEQNVVRRLSALRRSLWRRIAVGGLGLLLLSAPVYAQEIKGPQAPNCPYSFEQLEQTIEEGGGELLRIVRLPAEQYDSMVFFSRPSDRGIFMAFVKLGCVVSNPIPFGNLGTPA